MDQLSYRRHRFPPPIIQHAIWLYLRFTLSYRDVEELLAERGLEVSYETVRRWVLKFGPGFARRLRRSRPRPSDRCWGGRPPRHRCAKLRSLQISGKEAIHGPHYPNWDCGRDAHYWAPPAQNRTCGIPASGSHLGCLTAKQLSVHGPVQGARLPGSESGACWLVPCSPRPPPFAPPTPTSVARRRSPASQLLWRGLTSHARASPASAHHLPDADQGATALARREISRFPDKERTHMLGSTTAPGRPGARDDAPGHVAFRSKHSVGAPGVVFSRLNTQPMRTPVNASPTPSRGPTHDSGTVWFATPSLGETCTLYSLPVSRRTPCHGNGRGPRVGLGRIRFHAAATALCHCAVASARKVRS